MLRRQPVGSGNRRAALLSAAIALPIAVVVFFIAYNVLSSGSASPAPRTSAAPSPGSTAPVAVPMASLSPAHAQMCLAFIAQLGDNGQWHGLDQRHVTAGPEQNAAFGDPPITVQCGATPAKVTAATDDVWTLTGVCWYQSNIPGATVWTTLDRQVPVAVTIPHHYDPPGPWVNFFSAPLINSILSMKTPYNC